MVTTQRMFLFPISKEELKLKMEQEPDAEMKQAYSEMLAGCVKVPEQHIWYTVWLMQLKDGSKQIVGDLSFKGLHADGSVEIGYGMKPEYEGRGLATEAVGAMAQWAGTQPGILRVEAETEPGNIASQRVLQNAALCQTEF